MTDRLTYTLLPDIPVTPQSRDVAREQRERLEAMGFNNQWERRIKVIRIQKSKTADTRTCDFANVNRDQLLESTLQHLKDVNQGIWFFICMLFHASHDHDEDKISGLSHFHSDFLTGFKATGWWDNHKKVSRHHLLDPDGIPANVNLIDVIEMIVDCVMAGMGRSGDVYPLNIPSDVLMKAFNNTVELLKQQIVIEG